MSQDYHKCFSLSNKYAFLQILLHMCAELSALAPAFCPAWTEKSAPWNKFLCPHDSIRPAWQRNTLPEINFSAHMTVYCPA